LTYLKKFFKVDYISYIFLEKTMDKDDIWIVEHFSELVTKYAGRYIAVVNEKLIAVGDTGKEVEDKAREVEPHKMPSVLRVPREEDMACLLYWVTKESLISSRSASMIEPAR
jgi:hypothetical protein